MRVLFLMGILITSTGYLAGQVLPPDECHSPALTGPQRRVAQELFQHYRQSTPANARPHATRVAIKIHNVLTADGQGSAATYLPEVLRVLNEKFAATGLSFFQLGDVNYIRSDRYFNLRMSDDAALTAAHNVHHALNLYLVGNADNANGYAYPPSLDSTQSTRHWNSVFVAVARGNPVAQIIQEVIPHELGHYFGLLHTHEHGLPGNLDPQTREYVTRGPTANCTYAGDQLCDTPADPHSLLFPSDLLLARELCSSAFFSVLDPLRELYRPDVTNLMSYYQGCRTGFTPQQAERMQWGYSLRLRSHPDPAERYFLDGQSRLLAQPTQSTLCAGETTTLALWTYGDFTPASTYEVLLSPAAGGAAHRLAGTWQEGHQLRFQVPADLVGGTYTLTVSAASPAASSNALAVAVAGRPTIALVPEGTTGYVLESSTATNNQWYLDGQVLPGETGPRLRPAGAGTYTVATTQGTCGARASEPFVITATDLLPEEVLLLLYPNPNAGTFWLKYPFESLDATITITDLRGQTIYQSQPPGGTSGYLVQLPRAPGTYLLLLRAGGTHRTVRFVIQ
ncbi:hypothetical protein GCM10027275_26520 [Rhabdobacter roseus]|uniref:Peptidase M43 pregnancy-associated plasma-A domain-containing protein n=1 Tax=Rhabdobacter roseus TaxID=1655419 RepID=A0A840TY78_9BACT|nr:T9SS type A sorting domain-containing protein [Rhabdobacter roseus]MBB5284599.1 hypothetical protein [Rhabdobacter roseus]